MSRRASRAGDAPLLAWGDALRARIRRRIRVARMLAFGGAGVVIVLATAAFPPAPRLVWNASASAPIGLYGVDPGARFDTGDMVIAWTPAPFRALAAGRRYIPSNVPLVKRVAAGPGDEICALGAQVFINGRPNATRRNVDGHGRSMPVWSGCHRLREHQSLLLNDDPTSFDGRYFGPTNSTEVIGKARLLWRL